ncbi:unnamed protein product, partial [Lymnaea stagnalis]
MDKVKCYACGVGLFNWSPEVDPLTQHAKASPHCVFLIQTHGKEYIEQAQIHSSKYFTEQVAASSNDSSLSSSSSRTAATSSPDSSTSSWSLLTSSPGSLGLDMEAMEAAMACQ